jgi:hypothetical protein
VDKPLIDSKLSPVEVATVAAAAIGMCAAVAAAALLAPANDLAAESEWPDPSVNLAQAQADDAAADESPLS